MIRIPLRMKKALVRFSIATMSSNGMTTCTKKATSAPCYRIKHTHTKNKTKEAYGGVPEDVGVKAHVSLCYVEAALEEDLSLKGSRVVGNDDLVRRKKDLETALE